MQFEIEFEGRVFPFRTYSEADAISQRMRKYRTFYERDLLTYSRCLLAALPAGGLIVDIGANLGNHSVFWGAHSDCAVLSIEANPTLIPILSENLRRNLTADRFQVMAGGAGETSQLARMRLADRAPDQLGIASVAADAGLVRGAPGVFDVHPLPVWLDCAGWSQFPIRLLKIDVEGEETGVLRGAWDVIVRDRPEIIAEAAETPQRNALEDLLAPLGYRRVMRFCSTPTWHFSAIRSRRQIGLLRRLGISARVQWRCIKLGHSIRRRLVRAA